MQTWEYKTIKMETTGMLGGILDTNTLEGLLNPLGREGWELVSVFDTSRDYGASREVVAILKRPRQPFAKEATASE